ncbi:MAG: hypothetical protein HOL31_13080 [Candidatus Scalindua sp.]|nr:hypothetical protein [Candidatus Scalindua sp.]
MANIITSKTKRLHRRRDSVGTKSISSYGFKVQNEEVRKCGQGLHMEYLHEKRVLELHEKGFNEDAISGMIYGEKDIGQKGEIGKIIRTQKGKVKLDGNI